MNFRRLTSRYLCARTIAAAVTLGTACLALPALAFAQGPWTITDLGTLGGSSSTAYGVNNLGDVVGSSALAGSTSIQKNHAFLWTAATGMQDLGTLGGDASVAYAINDAKQVVGCSKLTSGRMAAFIWSPSTGMQPLRPADGFESCAYDINNAGAVAGEFDVDPGGWGIISTHVFFWSPSTGLTDIGWLGGTDFGWARGSNTTTRSKGASINDRNQIVGITGALGAGLPAYTFLWSPDTGMTRLPAASFSSAYPTLVPADISNTGEVVGLATAYWNYFPQYLGLGFSWTAARGTTPATPAPQSADSFVHAVNDHGLKVGFFDESSSSRYGFALIQGGTVQKLPVLPVSTSPEATPLAVNNRGVIVGYGLAPLSGGGANYHAVIWRPRTDTATASDFTVFRPSNGTWYTVNATTGAPSAMQWGVSSDRPVPADYDGDGRPDTAVFRPSNGTWYVINSTTGRGWTFQWGNSTDVPAPADYDGDGRADIAVFRPSLGVWHIVNSSTGKSRGVQWGGSGDIPVAGDFDGDGKFDVAVFRPSNGTWYIVNSSTGQGRTAQWGDKADTPVSGDYDGDGRTDVAIFRPSNGNWYIINSSTGQGRIVQWGNNTDKPVPADYDGDGRTDTAIYRPSLGIWYIVDSSTGLGRGVQWGISTDLPMKKP